MHLIVTGNVQGVGYRFYTQSEATSLGLIGWVRNLLDGSVEILARGSQENLQKLADWAALGPPAAKVVDVKIEWREVTDDLEKSFIVLR